MKLVVIGSSNMDLVISLPRIPAIGETVLGGKSNMVFGGKGANQAVASKRCGGHVSFIAKVGNDIFGENMKKHFLKEGFNSDHILTDEEEATGIAQIFVSEKGENSIAVAPGANMKLIPEDLEAYIELIKEAHVILLQLESPIETVEYIADLVFQSGTKLILNPAPAQKLSESLLEKVWLLTPNETEASLLTGIDVIDQISAQQAAEHLLKMGVKNVIITLGENGSLLSNPETVEHFPAFKVTAKDTTAAGDVFNGTLAASITNGKSLQDAITFASAAASISVTREGAQSSIPTQSEIEFFLQKHQKQRT